MKMEKKINLMLSIAGLHHGGAERVVANLCRYLDPQKYNVSVCWRTACGEIGKELKSMGYNVIGLPELKEDLSPYLRFVELKKLLKELRIDVIHTHDTGALADAAQCRLTGGRSKIVHTFHFGNYPNLKKSHLYMEMLFSRIAHKLIAVGYEQSKSLKRVLHLPESKISVLYNGVENPSIEPTLECINNLRSDPAKPIIIGSISTLTEQKGLSVLLDAAAILSERKTNCVLLIVGGGPLESELESKCKRLGLQEMVKFLGWMHNAPNKLLHYIDVFCQSSLWEANSIVLLEAMSYGAPIVTTEVGESRHVIDNGRSGKIVQPDEPEALAEALLELIDNRQQRQDMGENARAKFLENYTVDNMIENYEGIYQSLVGR